MKKIDLIIHGTNIVTLEDSLQVEAIAISGDKIFKLGKKADILQLADADTKILDCNGATVVPGLKDSHMHLLNYGVMLLNVNLEGLTSYEQIADKIKDFIKENDIKPGVWIRGRGWNQNLFAIKDFPSCKNFDSIADNPMYFERICGHVGVMNSLAMKSLGYDKNTKNPLGGEFVRDTNGDLTGLLFREPALRLIRNSFPTPTVADLEKIIKKSVSNLVKCGLTEVHTEDLGISQQIPNLANAYLDMSAKGELPLKLCLEIIVNSAKDLREKIPQIEEYRYKNPRIEMNIIKILSDGSLGARTAAMEEDYADDKGNNGVLYSTEQELFEMVDIAHNNGFQLGIHTIGDRSARLAIEAIEKAQQKHGHKDNRHRLIHCQFMNPELWKKMQQLSISGDVQPKFLASDYQIVVARVGDKRAKTSYAWKSMQNYGIHLSGGSDCPVEPPDPLLGMHCAMTRTDLKGEPKQGFGSEEKLSAIEALKLFTTDVAYTVHHEKDMGTIKEGKFADITVIEGDFLANPIAVCKNNQIRYTICNGKIAYSSKELS